MPESWYPVNTESLALAGSHFANWEYSDKSPKYLKDFISDRCYVF
jgi:hypothetical protein